LLLSTWTQRCKGSLVERDGLDIQLALHKCQMLHVHELRVGFPPQYCSKVERHDSAIFCVFDTVERRQRVFKTLFRGRQLASTEA
jgi:hypothetical protein